MAFTQGSQESFQRAPDNSFSGLECRVGRAALALPTEMVSQIIEFAVASPAPLANDWISGMGVHEGRVLICVSLRAQARRQASLPARRMSRALMLRSGSNAELGWAFEISSVSSLLNASAVKRPAARPGLLLPSWLMEAQTQDGRTIGWVDAAAMIRELGERFEH